MSDATKAELAYERAEADYKRGLRATAGIIALLVALCVLAVKTKC